MKKSVVNAAMLLALGVSGAANAVQMHGVIEGKIIDRDKFPDPWDNGASKAWSNLAVNDDVRFDFWLDSELFKGLKDDAFNPFSGYLDPSITVKATIKGVSHQINSAEYWEIAGDQIGAGAHGLKFVQGEWHSGSQSRAFGLELAFADNSSPVLKNLLLGKAVNIDQWVSAQGQFSYQGQVAGKSYDSFFYYRPTSLSIAPVPEPETWAMMLLGLGVVGYAARRRAAR